MRTLRTSALLGLLALCLLPLAGCKGEESDLTKDDKQKMDKLFTEGIKNPPSPEGEKDAKPMNQPSD